MLYLIYLEYFSVFFISLYKSNVYFKHLVYFSFLVLFNVCVGDSLKLVKNIIFDNIGYLLRRCSTFILPK
jgi:hypothetical protein